MGEIGRAFPVEGREIVRCELLEVAACAGTDTFGLASPYERLQTQL